MYGISNITKKETDVPKKHVFQTEGTQSVKLTLLIAFITLQAEKTESYTDLRNLQNKRLFSERFANWNANFYQRQYNFQTVQSFRQVAASQMYTPEKEFLSQYSNCIITRNYSEKLSATNSKKATIVRDIDKIHGWFSERDANSVKNVTAERPIFAIFTIWLSSDRRNLNEIKFVNKEYPCE